MPMRDYYLTMSGLTAAGAVPGSQPIISTASCWANAPFDTGAQYSGQYGQSPYQTTNLNAGATTLGQGVKKFFFLVNVVAAASGGTAACGLTVALTNCATAAGTSVTNTVVLQTVKFLYPVLTASALTAGGYTKTILLKVPLPEPLKRYINGRFTVGTGTVQKLKLNCELTVY